MFSICMHFCDIYKFFTLVFSFLQWFGVFLFETLCLSAFLNFYMFTFCFLFLSVCVDAKTYVNLYWVQRSFYWPFSIVFMLYQ